MKKVCFVCLGNICRSPMAEFVMKEVAKDSPILVESRATSNWEHGNPIHRGTQAIFKKHSISYEKSKSSQQIDLSDLEEFDYIIGMDEENVADLKRLSAGRFDEKIALFVEGGVPDPWYTGDFDETYALVKQGCQDWLKKILAED
ncbi:low molecular weight protein-tyrosine-phosphatase [Streptococcus loxodontisalivarius]|uniref:protein-tyrosine-phosphatase n=1 Tax=Streptococcus loxodontisalivarius TaxID=1349415 RepID=A0ABS2PTJ6_9STRE|nr:low molecular weight protein-tyrosine-phosphatase [Streptococcus loxodontisalivarius]MBM7643191.1 protein-tyrosine phosphatase [Streptococcus loxodontisalivarius]